MEIAHPSTAPQHRTAPREGKLDNRDLLTGKEGDARNYRLALGLAETDWLTPRHRHNFDQIRFPLEGEFHYAKDKILPAGWVGYFPEGVHYGPQTRKQGLYMLLCQFGGATGSGFMSERQYIEGQDALAGKGTLSKGHFTYVDKDGKEHRQDAFEAMYEQAMGRKPSYPEPRYNDIITMNPANFSWVADRETRGVERKQLGVFTERRTTISFIRLQPGAVVEGGACAGPDLWFVSRGSIEVGGQKCPLHSALAFAAHEGPALVKALEETEIFRMQLEV
jgi:hypothetical protein